MRFKVECKMSNAEQYYGNAPHDEIAESVTGDFVDASTPAEAVLFAVDWLKDNIPVTGNCFVDVSESEGYYEVNVIDDEGRVSVSYWSFTASEVPCIKYFVIDEITNGDSFGGDEPYDDLISAMSSARYQWAHLSDYDKKRRSAFYVVSGGLDDFGCYDACAGGNIHYDFLESEG